jgi:hypothetical protein
MNFLDFFKLEVVVSLAGAVGVVTEVIKRIPVNFTSDYPKVITWIVSAVIVGGIGYYEKADITTVVTVATASALVAHGLYDVVAGLIRNLKS